MESWIEELTKKLLFDHFDLPSSRKNAAERLGVLGTPLAVPPLIRALGDKDPDVRRVVATALGLYGTSNLAEAIITALENGGDAIQTLAELNDTRVLSALLHAVACGGTAHAEPALLAVCRAIGNMQLLLQAVEEERDVISLWPENRGYGAREDLRGQAHRRLETGWVRLLADWKPFGAHDELLSALGNHDGEIVVAAWGALAALGDTESAPLIGRVFAGVEEESGFRSRPKPDQEALDELFQRYNSDPGLALPFLRWLAGGIDGANWLTHAHNAIAALVRLKDSRGVEAIQIYLSDSLQESFSFDDYAVVQKAAVNALYHLGGDQVISYLVELAVAERRALSEAAANVLPKYGAKAVAPVVTAIRHSYGDSRERLANVLQAIGQPAVESVIKLMYDRDEDLRRATMNIAWNWGGKWREVVETILALRSEDPRKRRVAAVAASSLGHEWGTVAVPALILLLADGDAEVRVAVANALKEIRDISAIPALVEAVGKAAEGSEERRFLLEAIAVLGSEPVLRDCLPSWNINRRRGAAIFFAHYRYPEETLQTLRSALTDADAGVRRWTATALGVRSDLPSCVPLLSLLADQSQEVRNAVLLALESILRGAGLLAPSAMKRITTPMDLLTRADELIAAGSADAPATVATEPAQRFLTAVASCCTQADENLPAILNMLEGAMAGVTSTQARSEMARLGLGLAMCIARSYVQQGRLDAAIAVQRQVVALSQVVTAPQVEWRALRVIGECYEKLGDDRAAWQAFRRAIEVIDRMWFALLEEDKLQHFFKDKALLYDQMVLCCLRLGYDALSLEYGEKAKTRYLGDLIARRQLPRRRSLERVAEEFWSAVDSACRTLRSSVAASSSVPPGAVEVVGVTWGIPAPGSPVARPRYRAALEDYLGTESEQNQTVRIVQDFWKLAARLPGAPAEDEIRACLEEISEILLSVRDAFERRALPMPLADRTACVNRFDEATRNLGRWENSNNRELPVWLFLSEQQSGARWLNDLLERAEQDPHLSLLELRAVMEGLNAILRHEPVYAIVGEATANDDEQPILRTQEAQATQGPIPDVSVDVAAAAQRLSQTRWQYVERIARGETVSFQQIQASLGNHPDAAIVQFYVTEHGTAAYLICPPSVSATGTKTVLPLRGGSAGVEVFTAPDFTLGRLRELLFHQCPAWFPAQRHWLQTGDATDWLQAIDDVLAATYKELFAPIDARLQELGVQRLLLIPHRALHVIPLHALYHSDGQGGRQYLLDKYEIIYAPSSTLAQISQERHNTTKGSPTLVAVENPTADPDLRYSAYEVGCIAERFPSGCCRILRGSQAQLNVLTPVIPQTCFHFSGHARYLWSNPLDSDLEMAGGDCLSVGSLFDELLSLIHTHLASLCGCETGMTDPEDVADEYIGLAGGFLFAGTSSIVSTLWPASDQSSALLMDKFYQFHLCGDAATHTGAMSAATALRRAQQWVRDATVADIRAHLSQPRPLVPPSIQQQFIQEFTADVPTDRLFNHPYYWAVFTVSSSPLVWSSSGFMS